MSSPVSPSQDFRNLLETAWTKRANVRARTDAFRVLNGVASGVPGLVVDCFSKFVVVYGYAPDLHSRYPDFARHLSEVCGAQGITFKDRIAKDEAGRDTGHDLFGSLPETVIVHEGPLCLEIHLRHPRNVGLFLDTRPLRELLSQTCMSHSILNLFSYSCSLGLAAARNNSGDVVNVDVSGKYLDWGRKNFGLTGLPMDRTQFKKMDAEKYLDWAAKKNLRFDVIILDPPSFSRSDAGVYSFAQDYWRLTRKCAGLLQAHGRLYAMTNFGQISAVDFSKRLRMELEVEGRKIQSISPLPRAADFDLEDASPREWVAGTLIACEVILE